MVNDNINEIVSQAAIDQIAYLKKEIPLLTSQMVDYSKAAKVAYDNLGNTTTLTELVTNTKAAAEANKGAITTTQSLTETSKTLALAIKNTGDIMAVHNGHSREFTQNLKNVTVAQKTATQETILLTKEQQRLDAAQQKIAASLAKQKEAYNQLNTQYKEAATLAKNLSAEYYTLQKGAATMDEAQAAAFGHLEIRMKQAQTQALELRTALFTINKALGDSTMNVGNYSSATTELSAIKESLIQIELEAKATNEQMAILAERKAALNRSIGSSSPSGASYVTLTSELQQVNAEMDALGEKESANAIKFEQLVLKAAELKEAIASVGLAVTEAGAKGEASAMRMEHAFEKVGETLKEIGKFAIAFFGVQLGMEFIEGISEEFGKADESARKLKNTLDNVNSANMFGELTKQAEEFSEKFAYLDTYEVQDVFTKLITYGKLTEDQIKESLPVIIDFAAKTGHSLDESAGVIIKALEGSSKGLKEFGINIKEAKTATGEALPQAERFGFIMEQLKPRVEGAAEAFGQSFTGKIGGLKKDLREAELAISDFFVKLSGVNQANLAAAESARKESEAGKVLIDEYKEISSNVNKTAGDKQRLSEITSHLAIMFGDSVVEIDKETNSLQLNIQATQDLIDKKELLANKEVSDLVQDFKLQEQKMNFAKSQSDKAKLLYEAEQKRTGLSFSKDVTDSRGNYNASPEQAMINQLYRQYEGLKTMLDQATKSRLEVYKKLSDFLGGDYDQANNLISKPNSFTPDKNAADAPAGKLPKDKTVDSEKALNTARGEQYALNVKEKAAEQKAILDNENETYQARKKALKDYNDFEKQAALVKASAEYENAKLDQSSLKKNKGETNDSFSARQQTAAINVANAQLKIDTILLQSHKDLLDGEKKLDDDYVSYQLQLMSGVKQQLENNKAAELSNENTRYKKGLIDEETYKKNIEAIGKKYQIAELVANKAFLEQLKKDAQSNGIDTTKIQGQLDTTNNSIAAIPVTKNKSDNPLLAALGGSDDEYANAKKNAENTLSIVGDLEKAINAKDQAEIDNLERKKQLIDDNYNAEINAIQGGFESEQKKAQQIAVLKAQQAAMDKQIHNDEIARKRKMASADKVAAIANAVEKGAVAIVNAMDTTPVWLGIALAAVVAGTVALEIANISSTPLPQYRYGTEDHPGGAAILGDGYKKELVIEPGKAPYLSADRPTVYDLAAHTRVIPEIDLIGSAVNFMAPSLSNSNIIYHSDYSRLENVTKQGFKQLESTIRNKQENHFHWNNGELRKSVKNGNSQTEYLNRNFN